MKFSAVLGKIRLFKTEFSGNWPLGGSEFEVNEVKVSVIS